MGREQVLKYQKEYYQKNREAKLAARKMQYEKEKQLRLLARSGNAEAQAKMADRKASDREKGNKRSRSLGVKTRQEYLATLVRKPPKTSAEYQADRRLRIAQGVTQGDPAMIALHEKIKAQTRARMQKYLSKKREQQITLPIT